MSDADAFTVPALAGGSVCTRRAGTTMSTSDDARRAAAVALYLPRSAVARELGAGSASAATASIARRGGGAAASFGKSSFSMAQIFFFSWSFAGPSGSFGSMALSCARCACCRRRSLSATTARWSSTAAGATGIVSSLFVGAGTNASASAESCFFEAMLVLLYGLTRGASMVAALAQLRSSAGTVPPRGRASLGAATSG